MYPSHAGDDVIHRLFGPRAGPERVRARSRIAQQAATEVSHSGRKHLQVISALQDRHHPPRTQPICQLEHGLAQPPIAAQRQAQSGQRIVPVGVEAGRDEDQFGPEPFGYGHEDLVVDATEALVAHT
jgi:hypothetical protein